jgi:hypothetical protein
MYKSAGKLLRVFLVWIDIFCNFAMHPRTFLVGGSFQPTFRLQKLLPLPLAVSFLFLHLVSHSIIEFSVLKDYKQSQPTIL